MNFSTEKKRTRAIVAGAMVLAVGLALTPTAANADSKDNYRTVTHKYTNDGDKGGSSGKVALFPPGADPDKVHGDYEVEFHSRVEKLHLWDYKTDGHRAEAIVKVYDRDGDLVDTDHFKTGTDKQYNLGTPDGTGNIPEGYKVHIAVRPTGGSWSNYGFFTA